MTKQTYYMKKLILLLFIPFLICCQSEIKEIPSTDVTIVDGMCYYKKDMSLVTGSVYLMGTNGESRKTLYLDGKKNGLEITWFKEIGSQIIKQRTYSNGKLDGEMSEWHENGQLAATGYYKNGELDGEIKTYLENGYIFHILFFKNGLKNGSEKFFNKKPYYLKFESNYLDDLNHGISKSYYENGNVEFESNYLRGKKEGNSRTYFDNGKIWFQDFYLGGKKEGISQMFWGNGSLASESTYKNGKKDGMLIGYCRDGKIGYKAIYRDDKQISIEGDYLNIDECK